MTRWPRMSSEKRIYLHQHSDADGDDDAAFDFHFGWSMVKWSLIHLHFYLQIHFCYSMQLL